MLRFSIRPWALLAITAALSPPGVIPAVGESELTQYLNDHYKAKTFILHGFYTGGHLEYDSAGRAISPATPDDWTVAGVVRVEDLRLSGHHVRLEAERLHLGWTDSVFQEMHDYDHQGKLDKNEKKNRHLLIEGDLGLPTVASADRVFSQIFLTSQDVFADLVPDYWKSCILAATTGKANKQYSACRFSAEFSAIPGVVAISGGNSGPAPAAGGDTAAAVDQSEASRGPVFRVGYGVTPPKPLSHPAAEFSEEARRAKYGGTSVLSLVVDKTGGVRNIRIVRPLGMGLDKKAVETALKYTFNPATKDGQPVAVVIALEVDFHLF